MTNELLISTDKDDVLIDRHGQVCPAAVKTLHDIILTTLDKHYPKFTGSWHVRIDTRGGVVTIQNTLLSGNMGFMLKIVNVDVEGKAIMKAAGELFERYGIARERGVNIKQALHDIKRDKKGEAQYDGG